MPAGRPRSYEEHLAHAICDRIAAGRTLTRICREKGMPSTSTVLGPWMKIPEFSELYVRAKEQRLLVIAEQILEISDTCQIGEKKKQLPNGGVEITTGDMIERSKLRVESRKWLLARLAAKTYGDKQAIEHSGPGGGKLEIVVRRIG